MDIIKLFMENPLKNYTLLHHYGVCLTSILIVLLTVELFKKKFYDQYFTNKFFVEFKTLFIVLFSLILSTLLPLLEFKLFNTYRGISYVASIVICWSLSGQGSSIIKIGYKVLEKLGIKIEPTS